MNNKPMSEEAKKKISLALKGKKKRTIPCVLCGYNIGISRIVAHEEACNGIGPLNKRRAARIHTCQYCGEEFYGQKYGAHTVWCKKGPHYIERVNKIRETGLGRITSKATKEKISKARKSYLNSHPDKVPYRMNHYSKGMSYPERYFNGILQKLDNPPEYNYPVSRYLLDFAFLDKKIDLEIDGEQHYCDPRISRSDVKRTEFLEAKGWRVMRVRWATYKKLPKEDREKFIKDLIAAVV